MDLSPTQPAPAPGALAPEAIIRRHEVLPETGGAERARDFTTSVLAGGAFDRCRDDVVLAVSELVTNAIVHATGPVELFLVADPARVRVEVHDTMAAGTPVVRDFDPHAAGGRGMHIVDTLTDGWGVSRIPEDGKAVWANFHDRG